ncbi:MAG: diffusible signal factor-reguated Ax21 family protein [Xanthomonadaceae bacterium]|nr:diffusible signal factor-reguated Ax21 family protein [Xanthomonadaceae bacterium]MDP2186735.1 diffusible signal factor-reguated Ax21 family protein [Xanthomonadales bacterium]MDZ4117267.1 diffusible signal factor-reguated Ax21 family protein [Xanthomonadaceae bacterium]MDZ4376714.1 diffusible signal factor-reguated Ax21 family protein [Xanthomonadaceae bacterium]
MKVTLITLALAAAIPFAANADELSYNYLEAGYSLYNTNPDAEGATLNGSYAINDNFHVFGGYSKFDIDNTPVDLDLWNIGLGYRYGLNANTDLLVRGAYEKANLDHGFRDPDIWRGEAGVRSVLADRLEGWALAGYEDTDVASGDVYGKVGLQYKFTKAWGLVAEAKFIDGDEQYFIGPRLSF